MSRNAYKLHYRNRIMLMREARGLTQREVAAMLGISQAALSRWELDDARPSPAMIGRLAQVLRCRPGHLFPYDFV